MTTLVDTPTAPTDADKQIAATLAALRESFVVPVVRTRTLDQARAAAHALIAGGMTTVEITLTVPGATALIAELCEAYSRHPHILIGAGTVLTPDEAGAAVSSGAAYIVSPVAPPGLAEQGHAKGVPVILGGLSPTEIISALGLGADMVKVFPIPPGGGPAYIKALLGPFPDLPLMISGGPLVADLPDYHRLGVQTVSLTSALLPPDAVEKGDWKAVTALAADLAALVKKL